MVIKEIETLTRDERRALRGSKFTHLPSLPRSSNPQPRLALLGGPLATNKVVALAKFLERKLKDPNGLASINPDILELAVNNAKQAGCGGEILKDTHFYIDIRTQEVIKVEMVVEEQSHKTHMGKLGSIELAGSALVIGLTNINILIYTITTECTCS